ncbi:MAG: hypothetical protein JNK34_09350 [Tabrizicola sp.]|nr:hypothetical protein [Tabrizicola sp.]
MKTLFFAAILAALPLAATAEDNAIFVSYGYSTGSLPPEYTYSNEVTIFADGRLTVTHCKGYETEGPDCKTRKGKADAEAMQAIRDAAIASDLAARPAREPEFPMVGSDGTWGSVFVDGLEYVLLWETHAEDADRTGEVKRAIAAAIPKRFAKFMYPE